MALELKKILVPTDFSTPSLGAIDYAGYISGKTNAAISLLHVMESYEHNVKLDEEFNTTSIMEKGIAKKMEEIKTTHKELAHVNKIETKVTEGKIYKVIINEVAEQEADLVIMGTHGVSSATEKDKYVLGSNSYKVAHNAKAPVITLQKKKDPVKFDNIVLPIDVTKETQQKLDLGIEWAKAFGSTIHLVSVSTYFEEFVVDINKLQSQLTKIADKIREEGIKVQTRMLRHDSIDTSVVEYCNKIDADLVMIMTRQEKKWNEFFIGSSAKKIITNSRIPVMSVHPAEK